MHKKQHLPDYLLLRVASFGQHFSSLGLAVNPKPPAGRPITRRAVSDGLADRLTARGAEVQADGEGNITLLNLYWTDLTDDDLTLPGRPAPPSDADSAGPGHHRTGFAT